ncbi:MULTISPECIES: TIGR02677 family protein [unclassified Streptomyces]|uniref:TIGR02677 family protein n=1 Tax=unclassified Streptomyces TaxID=2593676 RepID=UPI00278BC168|nr:MULTISPECIES: TIGR02677 family protein [unclassified Streptomyces]
MLTSSPDAASPDTYAAFAHLTVPNAALYREVMGVFVAAKERFTVHLRPEDVYAEMPAGRRPADPEDVAKALDSLVGWGNLRADPDTARVTAVEDFYRKRLIYQLTQAGEAAEEALGVFGEALGRRGALQAVALHDIVTQLRVLLVLAAEDTPDPARTHLTLDALSSRFAALAENARAFMGSLQRTIDLHGVEIEDFLAYKDRLITYLEQFIQDLITLGGRIAQLLGELEGPAGVEPLLRIAAAREAADATPDEASTAEKAALDRWRERWAGLRSWFLSGGRGEGRTSQARLLRAQARGAIPQLLAVVRMLNERRTGRSDRSADFRVLARWFAEAPDDEERHRLWRVAFGLYPARHLTVDGDTLAARDAAPVAPATPWAAAEPLRISPQLRRTGSYERRGKARKVEDRSAARRVLAERAERQSAQIAEAKRRLVTAGPVRLSDLGELDPAAFSLFLQLLGDALATWRPGMTRTATTSNDGSMEIRLALLPGGGQAEIRTPDGVLRGPDHLVEIVDLDAAYARQATDPVRDDAAAAPVAAAADPAAPAPAPAPVPAPAPARAADALAVRTKETS